MVKTVMLTNPYIALMMLALMMLAPTQCRPLRWCITGSSCYYYFYLFILLPLFGAPQCVDLHPN